MVEFNILSFPFINCPISMAQNLETMSSLKSRWDWTDGSHSASSRFQYENWHRRAWRVTDHWPKIGSARAPPFPGSRLPLSLVSDNQTDRGRRLQRNPAEELESTTHRRPDREGFFFLFYWTFPKEWAAAQSSHLRCCVGSPNNHSPASRISRRDDRPSRGMCHRSWSSVSCIGIGPTVGKDNRRIAAISLVELDNGG